MAAESYPVPDRTLLPLTPQGVMDQTIQSEVDAMHSRGEVAINEWTKNARPASGWNLSDFMTFKAKAAPSVPQFPGASTGTTGSSGGGGWLEMVRNSIGHHEGYESRAYHGVGSKRRVAGEKYASPGHGSTEEVSVGYGFNLQRRDARDVFKSQLGLTDTDYDDVFNGKRHVSPAEGEKLRMFALYEANAQLDQKLKGVPLRDHQRAALVSLVYNAGIGTVSKSGLLDSVRAGNDAETASRILGFALNGGKRRRRDEAAMFLGAKASEFFASVK